nr:MAG TPA: hypothetical protein [Caudoviricetes sp.]
MFVLGLSNFRLKITMLVTLYLRDNNSYPHG